MDKMEVERTPSSVEDVTVFKLDGPLTLPTVVAFQATLQEPSVKGVIIDLSKVPHMDSAGLGVLLGHWSDTQGTGEKFALVGMSARLHAIFEITRTDQVLPIFPTQADAENSFLAAATA